MLFEWIQCRTTDIYCDILLHNSNQWSSGVSLFSAFLHTKLGPKQIFTDKSFYT